MRCWTNGCQWVDLVFLNSLWFNLGTTLHLSFPSPLLLLFLRSPFLSHLARWSNTFCRYPPFHYCFSTFFYISMCLFIGVSAAVQYTNTSSSAPHYQSILLGLIVSFNTYFCSHSFASSSRYLSLSFTPLLPPFFIYFCMFCCFSYCLVFYFLFFWW